MLIFSSLILNLIIFFIYPNLTVNGFDPHRFRLYGQFLDPNYYSIFLVLNFLIILNYINKSKISVLIAVLSLISIFLTFSRTGFIALLILFIFKFSKSKKIELLAIFIGIVGLIFSNSAYLSRFLFVEGNFDSFFYRILDFLDGVVIYFTNHIPQGFNNMSVYNSFFTSGVNNSSSFYDFIILNFLLTGGIYFIFLFSVFFIYLAKNIKSLLVRECLFLIIISSFGMNIFFYPIFTLYFTILSSIGVVHKDNYLDGD